jgi:DNA polymerase V
MGDIARTSINNQELLYKLFGINAEYLIDHAWGYEPCTMKDIKSFKPNINSLSEGQVLHKPYDYDHTKLIVKEMTDNVSFALTRKGLVTNQLVLEIGYDIVNLDFYNGEIQEDRYGRKIPKHAHGTIRIDKYTSSSKVLRENIIKLFDKIINKDLYVRRVYVIAGNVRNKEAVKNQKVYEQIDLFTDYEAKDKDDLEEEKSIEKDNNLQEVLLDIKNKFGKNSIVKGMNLEEGGTAIERNGQVGGHRG